MSDVVIHRSRMEGAKEMAIKSVKFSLFTGNYMIFARTKHEKTGKGTFIIFDEIDATKLLLDKLRLRVMIRS